MLKKVTSMKEEEKKGYCKLCKDTYYSKNDLRLIKEAGKCLNCLSEEADQEFKKKWKL